MTHPTVLADDALAAGFAGFERVLCAVDGSRAAADVVRQGLAVAAPGSALAIVAISDARGVGASEQATLGEERAAGAVASAVAVARAAGSPAEGRVICDDDVWRALAAQAGGHDALVVGGRPHSRAAGILLGSTASRAVHAAPVPVLVARPRSAATFPGRVLVASRGAADDDQVAVAAWIAGRHREPVFLAHVGASDQRSRHALARQAAHLLEVSGSDPVVLSVDGSPATGLPEIAAATEAGLIVLGSRGLAGPWALASVSERVAHRAACSVLVMRAPAES
jgi:nucleotide-binding universal stress UspA family protein